MRFGYREPISNLSQTNHAWWRSAVVYQIYPRSFADSNGDGIGDLGGIIQHLDHVHALGVDVIWLSPVYRSPQADNGYDISDYQDIDPLFGTLAEFDELLAQVHDRGMKLMMDLVVNHTSDEHPWFVDARSARDDPMRDWYIWRDAKDGAEPNNWGSIFGGSAWQWDEATEQYYLHLFDPKQPDLNWENPRVRNAVHDVMRWWLDRGVDGFRMDVINFISKKRGLPDAPASPGRQFVVALDGFADGPHVHDYLAEMTREVFVGREGAFVTVGEMPGVTPEEAQLYTDPARGELNMVFQFEHVGLDTSPTNKFDYLGLDLVALKESLHRWQAALAETGWNSLYWNNHDQPRVVSRFGDDHPDYWAASAKALATILHGMRGTPFVYQGEELAMTNYPFRSAQDLRDVEAVNYYRSVVDLGGDEAAALTGLAKIGRDNARTPMQWDSGPAAGFTTGEPWLPVNPNCTWLNAEAQRDASDSVFAHYRALIRLRHESTILIEGDFTPLLEQDPQIWAYTRVTPTGSLLVLANCGRDRRTVDVGSDWDAAELVLANLPDTPATLDATALRLAPWDARIYYAAGLLASDAAPSEPAESRAGVDRG
ncbi:alpha-glucosidase [Mycolicibacterium sp.]|uniref:glycoside hydrolase family 13 protein n=1 Tax=Mycolicibacterium sp. TaxID=2320850 RepID=UPI001A218AEE|nr:alpha-glucosidase [Mycolicibacterium sp.]MBJ7339251.1 alpha-glucosidase [Mycolicibacterium sp.]